MIIYKGKEITETMKAYSVTFTYSDMNGIYETVQIFYAESIPDLTEQIIEFEEDFENRRDAVIIKKEIKEVE